MLDAWAKEKACKQKLHFDKNAKTAHKDARVLHDHSVGFVCSILCSRSAHKPRIAHDPIDDGHIAVDRIRKVSTALGVHNVHHRMLQ